jgi:hypothetical protein
VELNIRADLSTSAGDFDTQVGALTATSSMENAIQMTSRFRNTLGHDLAWPSASLNKNSYNLAIKNVAASCLHAISKLY